MRCLQDRNFAERGIGNHARCVISRAPAPFIGLIDPNLPPLPPHLAELAASLSPHAYIPKLQPGTVLLNPSPMGPNQGFLSQLLCRRDIVKAALIYDFIPFDHQKTYLTQPAVRLDYFSAMAWLRHYNRFFAISEDTDQRLKQLYGAVTSKVTGVALPHWMHRIVPQEPRHILMMGGDEPRKNTEVLLRACAGSETLRHWPVVVTGAYAAATQERLRAIFPVTFPGRISELEIRALYARALCVVTPSRAEGFSLPVIEAMAASTPAVVSDIPAHRSLVTDPALRFAPDDAGRLTGILERLALDKAYRLAVTVQQWPVWKSYSGAAVAKRVWSALTLATPALHRHARPRLAMLTPLPPVKSGVADYSASLAKSLAARTELTLFTENSVQTAAFLNNKFDRVISTIGNSTLHAAIYDHALKWGSAAICHDSRLLGLTAGFGLPHAASLASAEIGRPVTTNEIILWSQDEARREASFLGPLAQAARPLIFHAPQPVELVQTRFGATARHLPLAIYRTFTAPVTREAKAAARTALKLDPQQKIIASFGFVSANKSIDEALRAFALLRATVSCQLLFVGEVAKGETRFQELAQQLGIAASVRFGDRFVPEWEYRQYLLAADAALQLRGAGTGTGTGHISGALQDCIAAGLPTVASRDLADNLQAPSYVHRVSDQLNPGEIARAMAEILDAAPLAKHEPERADYCETHSMARYTEALLDILEV